MREKTFKVNARLYPCYIHFFLEVLWQIPQKEANQRKNWFKSNGWVFSPLQRAHLYLETSGWVVCRRLQEQSGWMRAAPHSCSGGYLKEITAAGLLWVIFMCLQSLVRQAWSNKSFNATSAFLGAGMGFIPKEWDLFLWALALCTTGTSHVPEAFLSLKFFPQY